MRKRTRAQVDTALSEYFRQLGRRGGPKGGKARAEDDCRAAQRVGAQGCQGPLGQGSEAQEALGGGNLIDGDTIRRLVHDIHEFFVPMGDRVVLGAVTWELLCEDGSVLRRWRQSYNLVRVETGWMIFASTHHVE